jgi:hypothetical protein
MVNDDGSLNVSGVKSNLISLGSTLKINAKEVNGSLDTALLEIGDNLTSVNDSIATLKNDVLSLVARTESIDTRVAQLESKDASVSSQITQTLDLATQAVTQVGNVSNRVASTAAGLESLSRDLDKILASLNGGSSSVSSPDILISSESAEVNGSFLSSSDVYESLSAYNLSADMISVDGTLSMHWEQRETQNNLLMEFFTYRIHTLQTELIYSTVR